MIKKIDRLADGIIGFHASGVVTKEDYVDTIVPTVEKALAQHDKISVLYVIDDDFDHYAWQAMIEDGKIGFKHPFGWDKIALVTDVDWMINAVKYMGPLIPFNIKRYPMCELESAKKWLQENNKHLSITLDKEKHILTLEPQGVLTEEDFQSLSDMVDPYLAGGNQLKGLIIRTKNFPGWDSLSALKGHIDFVKQHHEKIEKLAFVTDSSLINAMKTMAGAFVHPSIKEFSYDAVKEAHEWIEA